MNPTIPEQASTHRVTARAAILMLAVAALLGRPDPAATQEQPFFAWSRSSFPVDELTARRLAMRRALNRIGGGAFVAVSGSGVSDGETFRVADDFLYFVGLELPESALLIDADRGKTTLFVPERDPRFESDSRPNDFPGRTLLADPLIGTRSGVDVVRAWSELHDALAAVAARNATIHVNFGTAGEADFTPSATRDWTVESTFAQFVRTTLPEATIRNAFPQIARLRMVKSPREIEAMRRTTAITVAGIRHAAASIADGVDERTLEGELVAEFKRRGAQRVAFAPIIKSGPNSLWPWRVLASHYDRRNRVMRDGDLVIFDVGAELDYYGSDIGRTFPVSGRFTDQQRRILEMEVAVADAIIAATRPGVTFSELQQVGVAVIPPEQRRYMQAGLYFGHHIGLESGDPSLATAPLQPGMIFTVEPWYYNHDLDIAVFTEDEILVTEGGAVSLTAALPRTPEGLERMVRR